VSLALCIGAFREASWDTNPAYSGGSSVAVEREGSGDNLERVLLFEDHIVEGTQGFSNFKLTALDTKLSRYPVSWKTSSPAW
jgi:hypothetical protein